MKEAELSMLQRLGASEDSILVVQTNLANTYSNLGRLEEALQLERDVYSGELKLCGEENERTLVSANNYSCSLINLKRFEEAKALLRKSVPTARRVLGENHQLTLKMRKIYARALYQNTSATLDDLREAVTSLEEIERITQRVFGGANPLTLTIEGGLREARAALAARETQPSARA